MREQIYKLEQALPKRIQWANDHLHPDDWRTGGYLAVYPYKPGRNNEAVVQIPPFLVVGVGPTMPPEQAEMSFELCQKNGRRLLMNPDHVSSWQTRNAEEGQYGGAIRANDYVFSFSGLTEIADEAVLVETCLSLGLLSTLVAERIVEASANPLLFRFS